MVSKARLMVCWARVMASRGCTIKLKSVELGFAGSSTFFGNQECNSEVNTCSEQLQ